MASTLASRVFNISELLHVVLCELGDPQVEKGVGSNLVACALVSQSWYSAATPLIWTSCNGATVGLFKVLGTMKTELGPACYTDSNVSAAKIKQWTRFHSYMHKMKTAVLYVRTHNAPFPKSASKYPWVAPSAIALAATIARSHGTSLFSSTQTWRIILCDPRSYEALADVLQESTRSLRIEWISSNPVDSARLSLALTRVRSVCSKVQTLHLSFPDPAEDSPLPDLDIGFSPLSELAHLTLSPCLMDRALLESVQDLPLTSLSLPSTFPLRPSPSPAARLPAALLRLDLSLDYTDALEFLVLSSCPALTSLSLVIHGVQNDDQLGTLFSLISACVPNVESLSLALFGNETLPPAKWYEPLKQLHSLGILDLYLSGLEKVGNGHIAELVYACPQLVELCLRPTDKTKVCADATLKTLSTIATTCRNIERLTIRLDCKHNYPGAIQSWGSFSSSLVELNMEHSPINHAGYVAGILCNLFRVHAVRIGAWVCMFGACQTSRWEGEEIPPAYVREWSDVSITLTDIRYALRHEETHASCNSEAGDLRTENDKLTAGMLELQKRIEKLERENAALRAVNEHKTIESDGKTTACGDSML